MQIVGSNNEFRAVTWMGSQFVAVGGFEGVVVTSPNGVNWSTPSYTGAELLQNVIWDGNQLVVVGLDGAILTAQ